MTSKKHSDIIVSDTSPLILLSKNGKLELLEELFGTIYIPKAVFAELSAYGDGVKDKVLNAKWVVIAEISNRKRILDFPDKYHPGEVEAMILYEEISAKLLIMDDKQAVAEAKRRNQNTIGLLGILIQAKKENLITSIRATINQLIENEYYINKELVERICSEFQE